MFRKDVEAYKRHFSTGCIFVNALSSTEASTMRWYLMDKETKITSDVVPVGYPVDDMEVVLLGEDGEDVGFDHSGEIAIRSSYLAPGYWNDPALSGSAFQPDAESEVMRVYRTGDVGVMREDGCLIHLGRKDFQIKIRGYRIDPGEIETALSVLDAIKEVIVVGSEDESGEQRLVAYTVPGRHPAPTVSELCSFLKQKLPDYMVPSTFVFLETLPLTPNGKVNRRALPAPNRRRPELQESFVAPRTPIEELLAKIWADVLKVERVGVHDKFFELGGHSLAASRVISQIIKRFQFELPLKSLFEAPTVAEMATLIAEHQVKELGSGEVERVLGEIESLSDEEAQRVMSDKSRVLTEDTKGNDD
jgi:acyl carrier protein